MYSCSTFLVLSVCWWLLHNRVNGDNWIKWKARALAPKDSTLSQGIERRNFLISSSTLSLSRSPLLLLLLVWNIEVPSSSLVNSTSSALSAKEYGLRAGIFSRFVLWNYSGTKSTTIRMRDWISPPLPEEDWGRSGRGLTECSPLDALWLGVASPLARSLL